MGNDQKWEMISIIGNNQKREMSSKILKMGNDLKNWK